MDILLLLLSGSQFLVSHDLVYGFVHCLQLMSCFILFQSHVAVLYVPANSALHFLTPQ